ncbi:PLP-dependent cysteine synthase family protein [Lapillicoccus jejuensis]|uniref:PLP-dependent cysteine synthase family protein n=1 Tax=Lapillicoccus jejuensis TaxID=402171 RepID=UPI0024831672|nr:PLP-dependent cysteine synthase family protein [Lapillicoccus jejuensis]
MPADPVVTPLTDVPSTRCTPREWVDEAVRRILADAQRSADTHLLPVPVPGCPDVDLYLKDESTHPTGSLKHRLARSLVLHALVNGLVGPRTTLVEASSGSTAVSEAYFARLLGLPFVAVMARTTSAAKIALIEREGGRCHLVDDPSEVYDAARSLADQGDAHYLDQFTYAERATDWRGNNTIASSTFEQLSLERHPVPAWVVVGAGTGGTSATIGRYVRYRGLPTRLAVVDPEGSAFLTAFRDPDGADGEPRGRGSRIEGIGRPRVEPSFVPTVVDRMLGVPDAASVAAMHVLAERTGLRSGPSTGTNLYGALYLACELQREGGGSIVTLLCDPAERYTTTYGDPRWAHEQGLDTAPYARVLHHAFDTGEWSG